MIKNVEILPDKLKIFFSNKEEIFLNIWLRDHAQDDNSWDKRSHQRKIFTAKLDTNLHIKKAEVKDNGNSIDIFWSDLNKSINYTADFFSNNLGSTFPEDNSFSKILCLSIISLTFCKGII